MPICACICRNGLSLPTSYTNNRSNIPVDGLQISPWGAIDGREMPIFKVRNWFNTWVNPTITDLDDPDAFVIAIDYVPAWLLKNFIGNPDYRNLGKIRTHEGSIYTEEEEAVQAFKGIPTRQDDKYSELSQGNNLLVIQRFHHNDGRQQHYP